MSKTTIIYTENDRKTLREGIQSRYQQFHLKDRVKYPDFEFNNSRASYEPLRNSFLEEFHTIRGIDSKNNTLHIPSISTFVQIFCDDDYVPTRRILNTCRAYAETATVAAPSIYESDDEVSPRTAVHHKYFTSRLRLITVASLVVLAGVATYLFAFHRSETHASGLVIERPADGRVVPMITIVEGKVSNADLVWIVVRDLTEDVYYVQRPIRVKEDSTWSGSIHVGGMNKLHIGKRVQIRAFVNPMRDFVLEQILYTWPKAELSSNTINVTRGAETK